MTTQSDRLAEAEFCVFMAREFPEVLPSQLIDLMNLVSERRHWLQENVCNFEVPGNHGAKCEAKIRALCEEIGCKPAFFGGPRDATVQLCAPSGIGICVPG